MQHSLTLIMSLVMVITTVTLHGQQPPSAELPKAQTKVETRQQVLSKTRGDEPAKEKEKVKTSTDEEPVVTHHRLMIDGRELTYTATAGLMPLKDTKSEVEARIFFVAYTLNGAGPAPEHHSCSALTEDLGPHRCGYTWAH